MNTDAEPSRAAGAPPEAARRRPQNVTAGLWIFVVLLALGTGLFVWASDRITPDGERTIYTVKCQDGAWQGKHCSGHLTASARFRFRALAARHEVLFWRLAANEPSGKFTDCDVRDGRNWSCKPSADGARTIALQMRGGCAVHDTTGAVAEFHAVPKWQWFLLRSGLRVTSDASL